MTRPLTRDNVARGIPVPTFVLALVLVCTAATAGAQSRLPATFDPTAVMERVDRALFPQDFFAVMRMVTTRAEGGSTTLRIESSHRADAGTFMEIVEPARSRGMRFLQVEDDLWLYNPRAASRRPVRLSPRDSFQGSLFANGDMSDPKYADDYRAEVVGGAQYDHPELGAVEVVVIDAVAAREQASYGRIRMWLRAADDLPMQFDYYAKSGVLFKRMTLGDVRELASRERAARMTMEAFDQPGARTEVFIQQLEARNDFPDRLFNQTQFTR